MGKVGNGAPLYCARWAFGICDFAIFFADPAAVFARVAHFHGGDAYGEGDVKTDASVRAVVCGAAPAFLFGSHGWIAILRREPLGVGIETAF